ncbi:ParB/Srx family N-terminal domain-containing protein [Mesonia mobilis]|uniref:ParB/Srx family N-terminal domain-containing protein n=1 Tax=Mesonia mobilis TaxID=369791 RepID=UPI0024B96945|nr:ParB/Srx family N-terminal domain-containing protein [Mesonia mobilis]
MENLQIKSSTNYDDFENINGNRNLNKKKIQKIVQDIKNGLNLLPLCPIIVYSKNEKLNIIDGQHRFEASVISENPVYYVISEELDLKQIATLNSRQDKWTQMDFLRCYEKLGIEDYETLHKVMKEFHTGISTTTELLASGKVRGSKNIGEEFRSGDFKINYYDETIELLKLNHSLFDRYVFFKDRNLISATQEIKKKGLCDFDVLKEKIKQAPMLMDRQGSTKDYIFNIERVYNHKNTNRKVIF